MIKFLHTPNLVLSLIRGSVIIFNFVQRRRLVASSTIMSEKTADSNTSSDNVNSSVINSDHPISDTTQVFIIPPNILQNICVSNSKEKDENIPSALGLMKKDNTYNCNLFKTTENPTNSNISINPIRVNKNISMDDTDIESLRKATEVPKINTNEKMLASSNVKTKKSVNVTEKQKKIKKIKYSTEKLDNNQTTSNDVPKPQKANRRSDQSSSKKYLKESIKKKDGTENNYVIDGNFLSKSKRVRKKIKFEDYVTAHKRERKTSDKKRKSIPNTKSKQAVISDASLSDKSIENNKRSKAALESHVSSTFITPALTNKSLPLSSSNSESRSTVKNDETNFDANNSRDIGKNSKKNSNEVPLGSIDASIRNIDNLGRPKKSMQETPRISDQSQENLEASQKMDNVSTAETVVHNERHRETSYNISNNDSVSDNSSTKDNFLNVNVAKKRGRQQDASAGRAKSRDTGSSQPITNAPRVQLVTCAKCEVDVPTQQWYSHNLYTHNCMSWIKGEEPMDFENDVKLWKKVLTAAIGKKKGKLCCEKCNSVKRSVNGFISHMQFCGKSEEEKRSLMVTCPVCGAVIMPSSMETHERIHRQNKTKMEWQSCTPDNEKSKRKAAEKAVLKILEFTERCRDPPEKKPKLASSLLKSMITTPKCGKSIPAVWKGIWKKELSLKGTLSCHQPGCTYTCTSFEDMCKHFSNCNFIPQECYMCKICKFSCISNEDMIKHVTEKHEAGEDIDKCSDFEEEIDKFSDFEEKNYSSDEVPDTPCRMKFRDKEQVPKIRWSQPYLPAVEWTLEFELQNYELHLFSDYSPNQFTLLNNADSLKYLPELEMSMRVKKGNSSGKSSSTEIPWKQWKRFEGDVDEDTPIFFTGGPVWALAWLPIPSPMYSKIPCQYIAISTHPTMSSEYTVGNSFTGHNMIQIWNVGPLRYETNNKNESPTLSYAIVHNNGTIWCLEWCPSGCYQDECLNNYKKGNETRSSLKRMGMLAAACSDGNIHIYSLPFPEQLEFKKTVDNDWPIYSTDPIITLVINISIYDKKEQNWQCTKLSWTKEHGHNTIAAGFSNGYIALWDLTYKSPLSMQKRQETYFINAFQHFYAHNNAVSMITLIPYNGERFLASGSLDRYYKLWNLEDTSTPQTCMQKGIITDGVWMTHWPCAVISLDDALGYKHTNTYLISLREHEFKYFPLLATNSPTYALAVSDYANGIAHGSLAGEVVAIFVHELVNGRDYSSLHKKRRLSSFVKIVDFTQKQSDTKTDKKQKKNSKDYHYMPETYEECHERFGIIFCDNLNDSERYARHRTISAEKLSAVPIEEYPFMSVNRINWNPNSWSYLWMVVGYQNGLIRLLNFKYMSVSEKLKTLLSDHVKHMLNKAKVPTKRC